MRHLYSSSSARILQALLASAFLTDGAEQHILEADKELGEFLTANVTQLAVSAARQAC